MYMMRYTYSGVALGREEGRGQCGQKTRQGVG